jgi:hypothetical protein
VLLTTGSGNGRRRFDSSALDPAAVPQVEGRADEVHKTGGRDLHQRSLASEPLPLACSSVLRRSLVWERRRACREEPTTW